MLVLIHYSCQSYSEVLITMRCVTCISWSLNEWPVLSFFTTFYVCYSCFTVMWTFLVQTNTSVVGKIIYSKSKHNDSETKMHLWFDHWSCLPVSCCLIGEELESSHLCRTSSGSPCRLRSDVHCKPKCWEAFPSLGLLLENCLNLSIYGELMTK